MISDKKSLPKRKYSQMILRSRKIDNSKISENCENIENFIKKLLNVK
jgi:hypothetical protein